VRALGASGSPQAPANLYRALDDPVPMVQEEAVAALAKLGNSGVVTVLRRRLQEAPPEERARALRLAALVRSPEMVAEIAPFLADPDAEVRAQAAAAILAASGRAEEMPRRP
jgi:HEAT repeat protein